QKFSVSIFIFILIINVFSQNKSSFNINLQFYQFKKNIKDIWSQIIGYGCTNEKIEIKDNLGQCKCQNGSLCVWTQDKPIMGCPCMQVAQNSGKQCIVQAKKNGCSQKKLECNPNFSSCTCPDDSQCIWAKDKDIMGCPCGSGKMPDFENINQNNNNQQRRGGKRMKQEF
ncbi:hypothetical protein IMG5_008750, partial [Ichthyophthirius multifiliis]